ncbi:hypothetical protein JHK84_029728 [Glycine max]|nr:hypothetical protein JHK85_030124 [Glycine max]KAG5153256.1 hypothetical protein JHK84_029728 [Glycine max]
MWHACHGEELGADPYGTSDGLYTPDYDDVDEFEQWLLEADIDSDYEEMGDAENNDEMMLFVTGFSTPRLLHDPSMYLAMVYMDNYVYKFRNFCFDQS